MKMTQCEIGKIGWVAPKVLFIDIESGAEIGVEQLYEFSNAARELAQDQVRFNIINYGAYSYPTKEVREMCTEKKFSKYLLGRALIVNDLGQFILAKHVLKMQKANYPTKIFTNIEHAKEWIELLKIDRFDNQPVKI